MKYAMIFLIAMSQITYAMDTTQHAVASPRTDQAAVVFKLQMLIQPKDAAYLQGSLQKIRERLTESGKSIYNGQSDLKIEFSKSGKIKVYRTSPTIEPIEPMDFTFEQFQYYLSRIVVKNDRID